MAKEGRKKGRKEGRKEGKKEGIRRERNTDGKKGKEITLIIHII